MDEQQVIWTRQNNQGPGACSGESFWALHVDMKVVKQKILM